MPSCSNDDNSGATVTKELKCGEMDNINNMIGQIQQRENLKDDCTPSLWKLSGTPSANNHATRKMNKSGRHSNLPVVLSEPSPYSSGSSRQPLPDQLPQVTASSPVHTSQQACLLTEVRQSNNTCTATCTRQLENTHNCCASKKNSAQPGSAFTCSNAHQAKDSHVSEDCKENSAPPETPNSLDCQPKSCLYCSSDNTVSSGETIFSKHTGVGMNATPEHGSLKPVEHRQSQLLNNLCVRLTAQLATAGTCVSESVSLSKTLSSPKELAENQSVKSNIHMPTESEKQKEHPSSVCVPFVSQSPLMSPQRCPTGTTKTPETTSSGTRQYQCPKCLLRFDRILAQLHHKCNPERLSGGSLSNRPALKLFKCVECCEEFSFLEEKIKHTCTAQQQIHVHVEATKKRLGTCSPKLCGNGTQHSIGADWESQKVASRECSESQSNAELGTKCISCDDGFPTALSLREHKLKKQSKTQLDVVSSGNRHESQSLPLTEASKTTKKQRASGVTKHTSAKYIKRFECGLCAMNYQSLFHMKKHIHLHLGSYEYKKETFPYVCRICKARFKVCKALKKHALNKCVAKMNSGTCKQKGSSLSLKSNYKPKKPGISKNTAISKTRKSASTPARAFTNGLPQHKMVSESQPHKCGFCSVTFDSDTALRKHVRSHWNDIFERHSRSLVCSRCNEEFDDCVKLYLHVRRGGCVTASDATSQSENEERDDRLSHNTSGKARGSSYGPNGINKHRACQKRKYHCKHCVLAFFTPQVLAAHMQSSHPLEKEETTETHCSEHGQGPSNQVQEQIHVQPGNFQVPCMQTQCKTSANYSGRTSPSLQDQSAKEDEATSSRTQVYTYRCNTCEVEFSSWRCLNNHRRVHHRQKMKNLHQEVNQVDCASKSVADLTVDIMEEDFRYPCNMCESVFCFWSSVVLHKKRIHKVHVEFGCYSLPDKQLHQETIKPSGVEVLAHSTENHSCNRDDFLETEDSVMQEKPEEEVSYALEDATCTSSSSEQHQAHPLSPVQDTSSHPNSPYGFNSETEIWTVTEIVEKTIQEKLNSSVPEEPKRTVEDLKILSVVSLSPEGLGIDPRQKNKIACDISADREDTSRRKISQQPVLEVLPVEYVIPVLSQSILENIQTPFEVETNSEFKQTDNAEGNGLYTEFDCIVNSVLAMGSSDQTTVCGALLDGDQSASAERETFVPTHQPGWHGTMKKIPFREAKKILKITARNPNTGSFHCTVCGEWFEYIPHFTSHVLAHCSSELFNCSFCGVKSFSIFSVLHHIIETHNLSQEMMQESSGVASQQNLSPNANGNSDQMVDNSPPRPVAIWKAPPEPMSLTEFPRPINDYVFKPSSLENVQLSREKNSYECPLCPISIGKKAGLIYHLRIHHQQYPYSCTHCNERFSFIPDVQIHFFQHHEHVIQEVQQQHTHGAIEHSNSSNNQSIYYTSSPIAGSPECQSSVVDDLCKDPSEIWSELESCEDTAFLQSEHIDPASSEVQMCASHNPPLCNATVTMRQDMNPNIPEGKSAFVSDKLQQVSNISENELSMVQVKQERISDDEAETASTSCLVEENIRGTCTVTITCSSLDGISAKIDNQGQCCHSEFECAAGIVSNQSLCQDQATLISEEAKQNSDLNISTTTHSVSSDSSCIIPTNRQPIMNLHVPAVENRSNKDNCEPCNVMMIAQDPGTGIKSKYTLGAVESLQNTVEDPCKDDAGTCGGACEKVEHWFNEKSSPDATQSEERVAKADGVANEPTRHEDVPTNSLQPVVNTPATPADLGPSQSIDDLFQLANDIGITVTGSDAENISTTDRDGSENSNCTVSVSDNGQATSSKDAAVEASVTVSPKRAFEDPDGLDSVKRQKVNACAEDSLLSGPLAIRIKDEPKSPVTVECREICSSSFPVTPRELSATPIPLHTDKDHQKSASAHVGITEDKVLAGILNELVKNYYTSRILDSLEKDSTDQTFRRNALDLDLLSGPPYIDEDKGRQTEMKERENVPPVVGLSKNCESQEMTTVDDNMSGLPTCTIFDVAGNGQMPEIPRAQSAEVLNRNLPVRLSQQKLPYTDSGQCLSESNPSRLVEYLNTTAHAATSSVRCLPGNSYCPVYTPISPPDQPSQQNPHLKALLKLGEQSFGNAYSIAKLWRTQKLDENLKKLLEKSCPSVCGRKKSSSDAASIGHYQEPNLRTDHVSPVHDKVGDRACSGNSPQSRRTFMEQYEDNGQHSTSPPVIDIRLAYNKQMDSSQLQQQYPGFQHSLSNSSGWSPLQSHQENTFDRFDTYNGRHTAASVGRSNSNPSFGFSNWSARLPGQMPKFQDQQQEVRSVDTSWSRLDTPFRGSRMSYTQQQNGRALNEQNQHHHSSGKNWYEPLAESYPELSQRHPEQQRTPASLRIPESGNVFGYHSMGHPSRSQGRERPEPHAYQTTPLHSAYPDALGRSIPSSRRQPGAPTSHWQEETSQGLPQIHSVASLNPNYLR